MKRIIASIAVLVAAITTPVALSNSSTADGLRHVQSTSVEASPAARTTSATTASSISRKPKHKPKPQCARFGRCGVYYPWKQINVCEQGGDWHVVDSMYAGGLGLLRVTWYTYRDGAKGYPLRKGEKRWPAEAWDAPPWQQEIAAQRCLDHSSWANGWPACSARLGLR